jgi:hypothetical protein
VAAEALGRQIGAVEVALVALGVGGELGDEGARQLALAEFLVGDAVVERQVAAEVQAARGVLLAMARDAFCVEDRLDVRG